MAPDSTELQKKIIDTLPGTIGKILKEGLGKGPERQKVFFCDHDVLVQIYGFISKSLTKPDYMEDRELVSSLRNLYYSLIRTDRERIRRFFKVNYDLHVKNVFCDFDIMENEGLIVFRCK